MCFKRLFRALIYKKFISFQHFFVQIFGDFCLLDSDLQPLSGSRRSPKTWIRADPDPRHNCVNYIRNSQASGQQQLLVVKVKVGMYFILRPQY